MMCMKVPVVDPGEIIEICACGAQIFAGGLQVACASISGVPGSRREPIWVPTIKMIHPALPACPSDVSD